MAKYSIEEKIPSDFCPYSLNDRNDSVNYETTTNDINSLGLIKLFDMFCFARKDACHQHKYYLVQTGASGQTHPM